MSTPKFIAGQFTAEELNWIEELRKNPKNPSKWIVKRLIRSWARVNPKSKISGSGCQCSAHQRQIWTEAFLEEAEGFLPKND